MTHTFGEFRLDPATRQVLRGSRAIPLSPKAFALLQLLLSEHPRAMSKRELFEKVWPGVFVSDATLASVVAELRRVLSDSARQPRYIRTVHRFGYAFCGKAIEEPSAQLSSEWELVWKGGRIPLMEGENVVGRGATPMLSSAGASISRRHARILVSGARAVVEDLGSKNGTFIGVNRIDRQAPLSDGDRIVLGSVTLLFRAVSDNETTKTVKPK